MTGVLIIILLMIAFEMIQIHLAKTKVGKWVLPVIVFVFSIQVILGLVIFESANYTNIGKTFFEIFDFNEIFEFIEILCVMNIPTVIFLVTNKIVNSKKIIDTKKLILYGIYIAMILVIGIILFVFFSIAKEDELLKSQMGGTLTENQFFQVPDRIVYKNSKAEYFIITPSDSEFDTFFTEISNRIETVNDGAVLDDETIENIKQKGRFVEFDYNTKSKNRIFPLEEESIAMINMLDEGGQVKKVIMPEKQELIKKMNKTTQRLDKYQFEKNKTFVLNSELTNIPTNIDLKQKETGIYQMVITDESSYIDAKLSVNSKNAGNIPVVDFSKENVVMTISKYEIASIEENVGNIKYQFSDTLTSYKVSVLIVSKVVNINCIYCERIASQTATTQTQITYTTTSGIVKNISGNCIEIGLSDTYFTHKIIIKDNTFIKDFTTKKEIRIKDIEIGDCIYIEGHKVSPDNDLEKIEANMIQRCEKQTVKKEIEKYLKDTYRIDGMSIKHVNVDNTGKGYIILVINYEDFIYPIKLNVNSETETYLGMGYHLQSNYGYILHEINNITLDTKITDIDNVQGYVKLIEYIAD